ncbi:MAG: toprim domain-containing protein [Nanoarchaeota archaeon]
MRTINDWVNELAHNNYSLIIVEGKKDKIALNKLGIENVNSINEPIYLVIEKLVNHNKEIIILTDLDREGKKIYAKLKHEFQRYGIKINNKYRKFLIKHTKITQIEGLPTYIKNNFKEFL